MPVLFVVVLLFLIYSFLLGIIHFFIMFFLCVRSNLSIFDALLFEVWSQWIILNAVGKNFSHFYGLPARKIAQNVRSFVLLILIIWREFLSYPLDFAFIMLDRSLVMYSCKFTYSRRPNKHRHDITSTNPTIVLILSIDTPLRRSWHELFVSQLALNYKFIHLDPLHDGARIVNSHRLDNVSEL